MTNQNSIDVLRLVWPLLAQRKAANRARAWGIRPLGILCLAATLLILGVGETLSVVPVMVALGILALALHKASTPPRTRRQARVLRDVRPLLRKPVIVVPEMKRAPRIVRAEPVLTIPALPPDRPRTRISERRPGPVQDDDT